MKLSQSALKWAGVCVLACAAGARAAAADFSRYQPILDRCPFGATLAMGQGPGGTKPLPPPQPAGPSFADKLQLCALTVRGDRIFVGFVDNNQKPAASYFMYVGESSDGFDVLEAEYAAERVRIRKGTQEEWINMGGTATPAGISTAATTARPTTTRTRRPIPTRSKPALTREEYLRQRKAGLRPAPTSQRALLFGRSEPSQPVTSEWKRQMRKYNMDLIRDGGASGPALPIELTPEEDAQLVNEGVLAPQE